MRIPPAVRTVVYGTGFFLLWGWLALALRRYDGALGFQLPAWARWLGFALIIVGATVVIACAFFFASRGRGTPAPFDPPRELVAVGPYRYVRNPMYVGALLVFAGFGLALRSPAVLVLAATAAVLSHLFVVLVEEPDLERRFGESYTRYRASVNRWLPRRA